MKRISSMLLSAFLVLSSLSVATMDVHAEETQQAEAVTEETSVEALAPVKVSVTLGSGYNTYSASFTVPVGKTLQVSYEFVNDEQGLPAGYQMRINGEAPTYKSGSASGIAGYTWQGGSVVDGITVGSVTSGGVPTNMALYTDGKPSEVVSYTASPEDAGSSKRFTIPTVNVTDAVGAENLQFDIVYVDHDTNEVVGSYSENRLTKKGTKSVATAKYGIQEITLERGNGRSPYTNFFASSEKFNGYGLYRGEIGAVELQKFHCAVGEDGVHIIEENRRFQGNDRIGLCYVEVNHEKEEKHTQLVRYQCGDQVVLEQRQKLLGYYHGGTTNVIPLDMKGVEEQLAKLGYQLDPEQTYTVKCNGNNVKHHDPEISVFTVTAVKKEVKEEEKESTKPAPASATVTTTEAPKAVASVSAPQAAAPQVAAPQAVAAQVVAAATPAPQAQTVLQAAVTAQRTQTEAEASDEDTTQDSEVAEESEETSATQVTAAETEAPLADTVVVKEHASVPVAVIILAALAVIVAAVTIYTVKKKHYEK